MIVSPMMSAARSSSRISADRIEAPSGSGHGRYVTSPSRERERLAVARWIASFRWMTDASPQENDPPERVVLAGVRVILEDHPAITRRSISAGERPELFERSLTLAPAEMACRS